MNVRRVILCDAIGIDGRPMLGYQFKAWAMRRRVSVVTISVTMGSPAGLIVRRAWNISSGSLNSHTAMVERPQKHSIRRGVGFHLHSLPLCDLKYLDVLVSFFCRIESDIAWLGRFPYTRYPGAFEGPKYKKLLLGPMMSGCCCVHSASRVSLITILGVCSTCTIVNAARPSRSSILVEKGSEPN